MILAMAPALLTWRERERGERERETERGERESETERERERPSHVCHRANSSSEANLSAD